MNEIMLLVLIYTAMAAMVVSSISATVDFCKQMRKNRDEQ